MICHKALSAKYIIKPALFHNTDWVYSYGVVCYVFKWVVTLINLKRKEKKSFASLYCTLIRLQLQGIKWIKNKYGAKLTVIRLGLKNSIEEAEKAVADGRILLIENLEESVDPVLENLVGRNFIRKGK